MSCYAFYVDDFPHKQNYKAYENLAGFIRLTHTPGQSPEEFYRLNLSPWFVSTRNNKKAIVKDSQPTMHFIQNED